MPVVRQPLRQRCNVQLSVITCLSDNKYDDISKDECPVRGRSRKRHARKIAASRKRKFKSPHSSSALTFVKDKAAVTIPSLPFPRSRGNHHLQSYCELIPFLSIAFSDGLFDPSTLLPSTTSASLIPFTHFIRIQYQTPLLNPGLAWSEYHLKTGTSVLNLVIPTPHPLQYTEQTLLTEHQLLLSRDFLSLALPYYCRSEPPVWTNELSSADMVHVLITAPPGPAGCIGPSSAVDVMSIVVCYLTFAGGEETTTVVQCVDGEVGAFELGLANVWKGRVKGDGVEVIQRTALAP